MHIVEMGAAAGADETGALMLQAQSQTQTQTHRRRLHSSARRSDARTGAERSTASSTASVESFAAVQHFGRNGRTRHFSLSPEPGAVPTPEPQTQPQPSTHTPGSFLLVHHSDEARRDEAAQIEKQQLLQALFSSSSSAPSSSSCSSHTAAASSSLAVASPSPSSSASSSPAPFSPRWYPLATCLSLLLPQHYPHSVTRYYLSYSKWMFVGSAFGTASSVLSMQCLLYSVGVGGAAAVPAAAAIAWVLKDGVGQLGGMLFAAAVSTRFDVSPLRYRLASALVLDASVALEMLTPLAPHLFLPLAALANTGKNIAWLGTAASRASIHRSFLRRENLADVTAKSGSQTILASLVGTAGGIGLSLLTGANTGAILACFAMLSAGHIVATYRALHGVVINQLHARRVRTLSAQFIRQMRRQMDEHNASRGTDDRAALSSSPALRFSLSTPAMLQRHEPLFFRLPRRSSASASAAAGATTATPTDSGHPDDDWCDVDLVRRWDASSSVDTAAPFEQLVAAFIGAPETHLERREVEQLTSAHAATSASSDATADAATAAPNSAAIQRALYDRWLAQFDSLPFVASLQLLSPEELLPEEVRAEAEARSAPGAGGVWARACARVSKTKRAATVLWHRRARLAAFLPFQRSGATASRGSYASIAPSRPGAGAGGAAGAAAAPLPLPRLHVRLLYKSGCSAEQLLIAPLYTTFVRERWADAAAAAAAETATSPSDSAREGHAELARRIHIEALQLLRLDAASGAVGPTADLADSPTSARAAHAPDSDALPTAPRPAPADAEFDHATAAGSPRSSPSSAPTAFASRFVAELQAAGFQTALHFVEDDNPVRIQLQSQPSQQLSAV